MLNIKTDNPNYLARIVRMPELRDHPNADRLSLVTVQAQNIVVGKESAKEGELYCLFPLESKINYNFLSFTNNFSEPELNQDKEKKGFFSGKCRVKATRLRQIVSEGYLHPVKDINAWLKKNGVNFEITEKDLNVDFSHIGETEFCSKYVNYAAQRQEAHLKRLEDKKRGKKSREKKIIDNQFRYHIQTPQLKRYLDNIGPEDDIAILEKIHGTSAILANVLCKKKLGWRDKVAKFFGVNVQEIDYDFVISSRKVIKNAWVEEKKPGFYDTDIWSLVSEKLKPSVQKGYSFYFEIAGFLPTGAGIQGKYDYSCAPGTCNYYIYRITYTNADGQVFELSNDQVRDYCELYGLNMVPILYSGKAKNVFPEIDVENHWHQNWLEKMIAKYAEGKCGMCKNSVWREGVVVRKAGGVFDVYKLKSLEFLGEESRQLDTGEVNIEDSQTEETSE